MTPFAVAKLGLVLALSSALGIGAVSAGLARPRPPTVEAPPPPPPPPPPPDVSFGGGLIRDAAAFRGYMLQMGAIKPGFTSASDVSQALRAGAAYEPGQLRRGAVVYAAAAALTDEAFVQDVRRVGATPEGRYAIVARIFKNPDYALGFADARGAEGLAKGALAAVGMDLLNNGDRIKQSAYDIQHQPWSLADVPDRDARSSDVKALSSEPRRLNGEDAAAMDRLIAGDPAPLGGQQPVPGPYSPLVVRSVALAALAAIGQAGDDAADRLGWMMDDYLLDHCLSAAKLALYECLAVAKPNYEDVFCLGQHAMRDTGECVARSVYAPVPILVATERLAIPPVGHGHGHGRAPAATHKHRRHGA